MASSEAGKMNEILYNHDSATLPAQEFPAVPCEKFHIINILLIKHVGPRWLDISLVLFLQVWMDGQDSIFHMLKKIPHQNPPILTLCLVNNPIIYVLSISTE